jgi:uncharacterized protein YbjT (DUF2867 family)
MIEKILVVGGSGMLGLPLVNKFADAGFDVSVMSTNPENAKSKFDERIKIVEGDITKIDTLMVGFENFDAVHLNLNSKLDPDKYQKIEIEGTANACRAARERNLKRITMISGSSSKGIEKGIIFLDAKVKAETSLIDSGVPYTIFRPSWFYESLPYFIQNGNAIILGEQPMMINWLAADDYATQVVNAYKNENAINKCFYNFGPEKMTMMNALKKYCSEFHPDLKPQVMSFFKAKILSKLPGMEKLKLAIPFFEYFSTNDENVDSSETDKILGKNMTTLDEWMKKVSHS